MNRIALATLAVAAAVLGIARTTSAETTVPMEELTLVGETTGLAPVVIGAEPRDSRKFQYPHLQYPHFQYPRFQQPHFQYPHFQYPRFQIPLRHGT